jgi:hypothetical protein
LAFKTGEQIRPLLILLPNHCFKDQISLFLSIAGEFIRPKNQSGND